VTYFLFVMGIAHALKNFVRVLPNRQSAQLGTIAYWDNLLICFTFEVMLYFHDNHRQFCIVSGTKTENNGVLHVFCGAHDVILNEVERDHHWIFENLFDRLTMEINYCCFVLPFTKEC